MSGQKVLVAYGSKNGGTAGIAHTIGQTLRERGLDVEVCAAQDVRSVRDYSAVVVGGALYMFRWHKDAARLVRRRRRDLAQRPVWLFSSGPLDNSADEREIPPVKAVRRAAERVAAREHRTFGGRLDEHARGAIARRMVANGTSGDFRNQERIREWAASIAAALAHADAPNRPASG